jgi:hypothetical protein
MKWSLTKTCIQKAEMQNKQWIKMETVKNGYKISHMQVEMSRKAWPRQDAKKNCAFPSIYDGQWPSIEACPNSCTTCIGDWTTLYSLHLFRGLCVCDPLPWDCHDFSLVSQLLMFFISCVQCVDLYGFPC